MVVYPAPVPHPRRAVVAVFALMAVGAFALFTVNFIRVGYGVYGDGVAYFVPLRSAVVDGDLVVSDEFAHYVDPAVERKEQARWRGGTPRHSKYPPGMALLGAGPYVGVYAAVRGVDALSPGMFRGSLPPQWIEGYGRPYEFVWCATHHVLGLVGLGLVYLTCRRFTGRWPAAWATLGVGLASPVTYYLVIEPGQSHAVSQFTVSAFVYAWARGGWRHRIRAAAGLGALLALATLVRYPNLLYGLIIPATAVLRPLLPPLPPNPHADRAAPPSPAPPSPQPRPAARPLCLLIGTLAVAAVLTPQALLVLHQRAGAAPPSTHAAPAAPAPAPPLGYTAEAAPPGPDADRSAVGFTPLNPALLGTLFTGQRPLFLWHPLTAAATLGLLLAFTTRPRLAACLLLPLAAQIYLIASWHHGYQGAALGLRMMSGATPLFALGLALLYRPLPSPSPAAAARAPRAPGSLPLVLTLLAAAWQLNLTLTYMAGGFSQRPVPPAAFLAKALHLD